MKKVEKPKTLKLIVEYEFETGGCKVGGPLQYKTACVIALAEAMKVVAAHQPPVIQPAVVMPNGKPQPN